MEEIIHSNFLLMSRRRKRYCWIDLEQAHGLSSKAKEDELLHQTLAIHRIYIPEKSYEL
jgi:hypothetical protein